MSSISNFSRAEFLTLNMCNVLMATSIRKRTRWRKLKSKWYAIKFNKNGTPSKVGNDALESEDYATVLTYSRWKIGALADELMSGRIAPHPTRQEKRTSCDYCDFQSICPFDQVSGSYREVAEMNNSEAVEKMRAAAAWKV